VSACERCFQPSGDSSPLCRWCTREITDFFEAERLSARHVADAQAADERHGHDAPSGRQLRMEMAA
jgi:hypothetical protein